MLTVIQEIPLSKLLPSKANVRRTGRTAQVGELAASIEAHGLLQNLTVRPVMNGSKKPHAYEVIAGGRRLAALNLLAKRNAMTSDAPIPCHIVEEGISEEISLAENTGQCPMHPADQYEAFAKLHQQHGMSAEDIAARFGVTATVVKQRLKLGAVSPKLMKLYRDGEMNLEQLSAFAISDDHDKQVRVWNELPSFHRDRESILEALNEGQVPSTDRRAVFVGAKAYEAAGGIITRDLFDPEGGGFFADAELLTRLTRERLQAHADKATKEGWKWVEIDPSGDSDATADMRRIYPKAVKLSPADKKRLRKLQTRHDALCDKHGEDMPTKAAEQLARLETAITALERYEFHPADIARAGVVVTLDRDGEVAIEDGFIRAEDEPEKKPAKADRTRAKEAGEGQAPLSEKLVADLTAHRTAALRLELAQNPAMALVATVHALAAATFYVGETASCLDIMPRSGPLSSYAPGIEDTVAGRVIAEQHEAWAKRVPQEAEGLWNFIHGLSEAERLSLLAQCVSHTVNAVQAPGHRGTGRGAHATVLAQALSLDMTKYWQPTAAGYFGRVSKERIVEAVSEGVSVEAAGNLATMKKQAMAEAAAERLAGKGWLPAVLRNEAAA